MLSFSDQVWETSSFTGSGDVTGLTQVVKTINSVYGTGGSNVFRYYMRNREVPGEYESGTGHLSNATTLVRDTVKDSSNGGMPVNFSAGVKDVTSDVSVDDLVLGRVREVTASGDITMVASDDIILVNKAIGAATAVNLLTVAGRRRPIGVKDIKGDAETNNITLTPNGVETIDGNNNAVINFNKGALTIHPLPDESGWFIM